MIILCITIMYNNYYYYDNINISNLISCIIQFQIFSFIDKNEFYSINLFPAFVRHWDKL